jgi:hypothetical protein
MPTKTFKASGSIGVLMISDFGLTDNALSNPAPYLANLNFHSGLQYMQIRATVSSTNNYYPQIDQYIQVWSDGGCDCFTPNSLVTLSDGTKKQIVDIKIGDKVLSASSTSVNTVTFIEKVPDSVWECLYSPDKQHEPFATVNHPLYINNKLCAVNPNYTYNLYPWLGKINNFASDVTVIPTTGKMVYNLWTTGDGTYQINGYGTHSIMYDGAFLQNCADKCYLTQEEVQSILQYFTSQGFEVQYGAYIINYTLGKFLPINILHKFISKRLTIPSFTKTLITKIAYAIGKTLRFCKGIKWLKQ